MAEKINKKPSKISGYYLNNSRKNFDYTMNRFYDLLEKDAYYQEQTEFLAKIVSGIATGDNTTSQFDNFFGLLNGVEQQSYKIRFIEHDEKFNKDIDPATPGLTPSEINRLIKDHPDAFYESSDTLPQAPSFDSIVLVSKEGLVYKIIKTLSNAQVGVLSAARSLTGRESFDVKSPSFLSQINLLSKDPDKLKEKEIKPPKNLIDLLYNGFGENPPVYNEEAVFFFGVRNLGKSSYNTFADSLVVAVWKSTGIKFYKFVIATTPGSQFLKDLAYTANGTLVLASPQHIKKAYKFGKHKGQYLALVQEGTFFYWRDSNRDGKPTDEPGENVVLRSGSSNGVNMHRASATKKTKNISGAKGKNPSTAFKYEKGKWTKVTTSAYTYSAGCQVFSDPVDFSNFLDLVGKDGIQNNKSSWDYFLIDSEDFTTLMSGKSIKNSIMNKQVKKGIK